VNVWALVPIKCFRRGKSRLSPVLDGAARERLARALCDGALAAAAGAGVAGVLVATDCAEVAARARRRGACAWTTPLPMPAAVDAGLQMLARARVDGAVVLMSDLPLARARDVAELARLVERHERVIVPDRRDAGTNALALRLHRPPRTSFGHADSAHRHVAQARAAGLDFIVHHDTRLGLDVDLPADLRRF
jgi:2-phospho-L-lactate guanylyltransferase